MSDPGPGATPTGGDPGTPGRPWSFGGGLVLLGLLIAIIGNAVGIQHKADPNYGPLTQAVYAFGVLVSATGVHRLLWFRPSARPLWLRVLVTAVVTVPVFALVGLALSFLILMLFYRFG
jgi:hypothetical protein